MSKPRVYVTDRLTIEDILQTTSKTTISTYQIYKLSDQDIQESWDKLDIVSRVQEPEMAARIAAVTKTKFQASPGFNPPLDVGEYLLYVVNDDDAPEDESGLEWYAFAFEACRDTDSDEFMEDLPEIDLGNGLTAKVVTSSSPLFEVLMEKLVHTPSKIQA